MLAKGGSFWDYDQAWCGHCGKTRDKTEDLRCPVCHCLLRIGPRSMRGKERQKRIREERKNQGRA